MVDLANIEAGTVIASKTIAFSRDSLVRYAGASGDFNTIHYRDDIAAEVGLPGVLAHGMLTMGSAITAALDEVVPLQNLLSYSVRFTKPVLVPAKGNIELQISVKLQSNTETEAKLALEVKADEQSVLGKAFATVRI